MKDKDTVSSKPDFWKVYQAAIDNWNEMEYSEFTNDKDAFITGYQNASQSLQSRIADLEKELCDTKANLGRAYNGINHRDERLDRANEYLEREGKDLRF